MASNLPTTKDEPITITVHMTIRPANQARFEELWREMLQEIKTTEPPGNIKYHLFRNNRDENDLTIIETCVRSVSCLLAGVANLLMLTSENSFVSKEVMNAFFKKPKQEEILSKAMKEGLIEADDSRYYTRIGGTSDWK